MVDHYYSENPESEYEESEFKVKFKGKVFTFKTAPGVFSKDRVDTGTKVLIKNMKLKGGRLLDMGCGYGPVGIIAAKLNPDLDVVMTDINKRAVKLARKNSKLNEVNLNVIQGDMYESVDEEISNSKFDVILSNPPMKAGLDTCYQIIEKALNHLKEGGFLEIVARHNKGGSRLRDKMKEVFSNVETLVKSGGFRVYLSEKES